MLVPLKSLQSVTLGFRAAILHHSRAHKAVDIFVPSEGSFMRSHETLYIAQEYILEPNAGTRSSINIKTWLATPNSVNRTRDNEMCLLMSVAQITFQYERGCKLYTT